MAKIESSEPRAIRVLSREFSGSTPRNQATRLEIGRSLSHNAPGAGTTIESEFALRTTMSSEPAFPLTPLQRGFYLEYHSTQDAGLNILQATLRMRNEEIDTHLLQSSWAAEAAKEPFLRTRFSKDNNGEPCQSFANTAEIDFTELDLRTSEGKTLADVLAEDREQGIPADRFPLWHVRLIRIDDAESVMLWSVHHAVIDGYSLVPVIASVIARYQAFAAGETPVEEPALPFHDFARWCADRDWTSSEQYWAELFKGYEAPEPLKYFGVRPTGQPSRAHEELWIDSEQQARWKACAAEFSLPMNTLVQGAWALLLARYQRREDVVFGAVRAGRFWNAPERDQRNGVFIANAPVRVKVPTNQRLSDYLLAIRQQHLDIRPHEHCPLTQIADFTGLKASELLGQSSVMFDHATWEDRLAALGEEWPSREFELFEKSSPPLVLTAYSGDNRLRFQLEFDGTEFPRSFIGRMLGHLAVILDRFASNSQACLKDVSLLTPTEFEQVVNAWNRDTAKRPQKPLHEAFADVVEQQPDAIALQFGEQVLSYRQLDDYAESLAALLQSAGTELGEPVAVCMPRSLESMISLLAILKAGGAFVPIDPECPPDRQLRIAQEAGVNIVLGKDEHLDQFPDSLILLNVNLDWLIPGEREPVQVRPDEPAYIIFTSGSTGPPKGVVNTHQGTLNEALTMAEACGNQPGSRVMQFASIGFDAAQEEIWSAWLSGGRLVLRPDDVISSYPAFVEWITQNEIAVADLPTAFWHGLVAALDRKEITLPASLRIIIVGGETAQAAIYQTWKKAVGDRHRWVNTYGPTEAAIVATYYRDWCDPPFETDDIPIGVPLTNYRCYITDPAGHPVPPGVVGELLIGGIGVATGYLNRPEMTAEKFIVDPFAAEPGGRIYKTGDLAWWDEDGMIHFIGRLDRQVKIRGFRVDPAEIESVLNGHEDIEEGVIRIFDAKSDHPWLMAYAVTQPDTAVTETSMMDYLRNKLPHYMIPRGVTLIDAMPKNVNGKIDLKQLPEPLADERQRQPERARNGMEEAIHQIFCGVLQRQDIRLDDDFFTIGGDSLHSMQVIMRAQQASLSVQPQDLVRFPTIEKLSAYLEERYYDDNEKSEWSCLVPLQTEGDKPPLILFHPSPGDVMGYGNLVHQLGADQPCYGFVSPGLLPGGEIPDSLEKMAEIYVNLLLESDIPEPYQLGGWCFAGILALEAAQQLRRRGKSIAYVGLFDANALPLKSGQLKQKVRKITNAITHDPIRVGRFLWQKAQTAFFTRDEPTPDEIGGDGQGALENRSRVYDSNSVAYDNYRAEFYPGKVHVYLSTKHAKHTLPNLTGGWDVAAAEHEVNFIDCTHTDILKEPAVADMAEKIRDALTDIAAANGIATTPDHDQTPPTAAA
jgi:amino acid adenylation domain-containing protein